MTKAKPIEKPDPRPSDYDAAYRKAILEAEPGYEQALQTMAKQPIPYDVLAQLKEEVEEVVYACSDEVTAAAKDEARAKAVEAIEKIMTKDRKEMADLLGEVDPIPPTLEEVQNEPLGDISPAQVAEFVAAWIKENSMAAKDMLLIELSRQGAL
jgi:hypothetical protein